MTKSIKHQGSERKLTGKNAQKRSKTSTSRLKQIAYHSPNFDKWTPKVKKTVKKQWRKSDLEGARLFSIRMMLLVGIFFFIYWLWAEDNEPKAVFTGLFVVILAIPDVFRLRRW